jgi:hypothetical protein
LARSVEINICVKLLLSCIHGGFLWLDREVSIDTHLIACDYRISISRGRPSTIVHRQDAGKILSRKNEGKIWHIQRSAQTRHHASINDDTIRFVTQVLACKLLRKCCKDQVPAGVIEATEKCIAGVMMNWSTFLMNQFLMDCREAQEKGT